MSFYTNFGNSARIAEEIKYNPKKFYKIFQCFSIDGFTQNNKKIASLKIREIYQIPLMDSKKVLQIIIDDLKETEILRFIDNINEFMPEYVI